ncbi:MAG: 50S ribosomal protein L3 [Candidatus Aenigmarchaeota archaeon]|nr:50S ribosomal protein L3 [Candidatus Aenigmarchaeota archaeon]
MVRKSKPRAGSLAFWPRKRAKRIYPRVKTWPETEKIKIAGFAGYKSGMAHVSIIDNRKYSLTKGQEITVPVTILDCPPMKVLGIRVYGQNPDGLFVLAEAWDEKIKEDKDLDRKILVGKTNFEKNLKKIENNLEKIEKLRLIVRTQPRKSEVKKKKPEIFEIEVTGSNIKEKWKYSKELIGKEIRARDVFKEGEYIDVIAVTKGKGTQGPVKRFGIKIQTRKASQKRRHTGTLGPETPRRVLWTVPFAGQMGFHTRTEHNKRILKIGENGKEITPKSGFVNYGVIKGDYMLVEGSLPGSKKRLIRLRSSVRPPKVPVLPIEIKHISTQSERA